jgi:SAM-dependent methyltransferase
MGERHWFEGVADHLGEAYLHYSFTKGTDQEVGFLVEELGLASGMRVLDVGCGPGRHAHALARSGIEVVGVDISERFIELAHREAPPGATFVRGDARALGYDAEFDAVISLCQGAFGLCGGPGSPVDPDPPGQIEELRGSGHPQRSVTPPSVTIVWPRIHRPAGVVRKWMIPAISSGLAIRPAGVRAAASCSRASGPAWWTLSA